MQAPVHPGVRYHLPDDLQVPREVLQARQLRRSDLHVRQVPL